MKNSQLTASFFSSTNPNQSSLKLSLLAAATLGVHDVLLLLHVAAAVVGLLSHFGHALSLIVSVGFLSSCDATPVLDHCGGLGGHTAATHHVGRAHLHEATAHEIVIIETHTHASEGVSTAHHAKASHAHIHAEGISSCCLLLFFSSFGFLLIAHQATETSHAHEVIIIIEEASKGVATSERSSKYFISITKRETR